MTQENPQQPDQPDSGGKPAAPNQEVVAAINALGEKYEASQKGRPEHDSETLKWAKRAGWGIGIYTLLTLGIAIVALCQLRTARDMEQRQLRAYVGFVSKDPITTDPQRVVATLKNFGLTPAKRLKFFSNWEFRGPKVFRLPNDFAYPEKRSCTEDSDIKSVGVIYPGDMLNAQHLHCPDEVPQLLQAEAHTMNAFYYGHIEYTDVFDNDWRTNFCALYSLGMIVWCDRYNEIDAPIERGGK